MLQVVNIAEIARQKEIGIPIINKTIKDKDNTNTGDIVSLSVLFHLFALILLCMACTIFNKEKITIKAVEMGMIKYV